MHDKNLIINPPPPQSFGFLISFIFLIVGLYPLYFNSGLNIWSLFISFILLIIAKFYPNILKIPNNIWFKFSLLLGALSSPIVLGFIFFLILCPTSFFVKLIGKDSLNIEKKKNIKSYWIKRNLPIGPMSKQF
jgi:hypothetical protein